MEEVVDKSKSWQLSEIMDSGHCRLVTMPDATDTSSKVLYVSIVFTLFTLLHTKLQLMHQILHTER